MSPLGETLQRTRLARGVTLEEAERITRIPRRYLEALEQEDYGILPAPVYARGFLRSYASFLGLDPKELLPLFPVGHVEEPKLEPLPQVKQPRTWNLATLIPLAVVGLLILIVVALYSLGREGSGPAFLPSGREGEAPGAVAPTNGEGTGRIEALPNLKGFSLDEAVSTLEKLGAEYVVVAIRVGNVPKGQVVEHWPAADASLNPGQIVTLVVSR